MLVVLFSPSDRYIYVTVTPLAGAAGSFKGAFAGPDGNVDRVARVVRHADRVLCVRPTPALAFSPFSPRLAG